MVDRQLRIRLEPMKQHRLPFHGCPMRNVPNASPAINHSHFSGVVITVAIVVVYSAGNAAPTVPPCQNSATAISRLECAGSAFYIASIPSLHRRRPNPPTTLMTVIWTMPSHPSPTAIRRLPLHKWTLLFHTQLEPFTSAVVANRSTAGGTDGPVS